LPGKREARSQRLASRVRSVPVGDLPDDRRDERADGVLEALGLEVGDVVEAYVVEKVAEPALV